MICAYLLATNTVVMQCEHEIRKYRNTSRHFERTMYAGNVDLMHAKSMTFLRPRNNMNKLREIIRPKNKTQEK